MEKYTCAATNISFALENNDWCFINYHAYARPAKGVSLLNIKPMYNDEDFQV
jgi:hypothetical protein